MIKKGDRVLITRQLLRDTRQIAFWLGISEAEALERVVWIRATVTDADGWGYDVRLANGSVVHRSPREVKPYSAIDALADLHRCESCMDYGKDRCQRHYTNCPDGVLEFEYGLTASTHTLVTIEMETAQAEGADADNRHRKPRGDAAWRDYLVPGRGRERGLEAQQQHGRHHQSHRTRRTRRTRRRTRRRRHPPR